MDTSLNSGKISVKEVPFTKLVDIYFKRMHEEIMAEDICLLLKNI